VTCWLIVAMVVRLLIPPLRSGVVTWLGNTRHWVLIYAVSVTTDQTPGTDPPPMVSDAEETQRLAAAAASKAEAALAEAQAAAAAAAAAAKAAKDAADMEAMNKIVQAISEHVPNVEPCPFCGTRSGYTLTDGLVQMRVNDFGSVPVAGAPGRALPLVVMSCKKCGHTLFLNVYQLGLPELTSLNRNTSDITRPDIAQTEP